MSLMLEKRLDRELMQLGNKLVTELVLGAEEAQAKAYVVMKFQVRLLRK